ncbi:Glycosyltransferase involved in cell wall bisynthesis [Catalinimonas alkaloidigena]|uniref:Glycosyltransferase involved in cell wall bisynthesis n=1 Tax=Catalinimonas alkaloidigena TaxID=1075417 RepID=A0A1G9LDC2_9BACT|nr:glycosyltransferase family 4 protein [Catalinimonas alkaloidigena]SDL59952.1 Glycosyltransferase involved in cell wall bisynthesis [Catalinimonas alkaloidigena]
MKNIKILFVGNDAGRTGAPIILLNFLKWLSEKNGFSLQLLLWNDGDLLEEYRAVCPTRVWNFKVQEYDNFAKRASLKSVGYVYDTAINKPRIKAWLKREKMDLIYVNTGATGPLIPLVKRYQPQAAVICHVHELEFILRFHCGHYFEAAKPYVDHFIAASTATAENLLVNHNVAQERLSVVYEFVKPIHLEATDIARHRNEIRKKLGIPSDAFVVGCSGVGGWRKGTDLFLPIAKQTLIQAGTSDIYFVWIGFDKASADMATIKFDAEKLQIEKHIRLLEKVSNPIDYYCAFDLFMLTSREDPFPLVCLEAAALSVPFICFEKSGGMPEFAEQGAGFLVPYLSINDMAAKIYSLKATPDMLHEAGRTAKAMVAEKYAGEKIGEQLLDTIKQFVEP